jgi:hypothetical protein
LIGNNLTSMESSIRTCRYILNLYELNV